MHISHTKFFNIPISIAIATLAHMINVYKICLNATKYPIFNMQDFRYCLWTSILDSFGELVSPPCKKGDGHKQAGYSQNIDNILKVKIERAVRIGPLTTLHINFI